MRITPLVSCCMVAWLAVNQAGARSIQFAGLTWDVKLGNGLGPGPNNWSDSTDSVWVDAQGQLHLKIRNVGSSWYCAEVVTQQSFGYRTYLFKVGSDANLFDKNVVVGLFTYLNDTNEIDIEFSRWGNANNQAAQYVTQPGGTGNIHRFDLSTAGVNSTHSFTWQASSIFYQSYQGYHNVLPALPSQFIQNWNYTGASIPLPSTEKLRINLWLYKGTPPSNGLPVELIINDFRILDPATQCLVDADCDDSLFCTGAETCVDGQCQAGGDPCAASGATCDEAGDLCECDNAVVHAEDYSPFAACLAGPDAGVSPGCLCSDSNADDHVDLADYALFQAAFSSAPPPVILFDFESGSQGWASFGEGSTGNGLLPTGGSGGAGPQGRYHRADFDTPTMTYGFGDISPTGQNLSAYTGMSIDMRLRSHVPSDPFVGTPEVEFMLAIGYAEWAKTFTLADTYQTCTAAFTELAPQGTATQPITPAQLASPSLRIKLIMRKRTNHGQVELDYDQVMAIP